VGGTAGTDGVYTATISGGGGNGAAATYVVSGGAVTTITITNSGIGYTSSPTITFGAVGLIGASATMVIGDIVPAFKYYWVSTTDGFYIELYQNNAGTPLKVSPAISIPSKLQIDKIQETVALQSYLASQPFANVIALNAYTNTNLSLNDSTIIHGDGRYVVTSLTPLTWTRQGDSDGKIAANNLASVISQTSTYGAASLAAQLRVLQNLLGTTALSALTMPKFDTFSTNPGNIIGRALSSGGTWSLERGTDGSATHDTSMSVSNGAAGGNSVAGAGNHFAVVTSSASSQTILVARRKSTAFSANHIVDHVTASGGTVANITRFGFTPSSVAGPPLSGQYDISTEVAGGNITTTRTTNNLRFEPFDIDVHEYIEGSGNSVTIQLRRNGRARDLPLDVSFATRNVPLSKKFGFSGNTPPTFLDWMAVVDPAIDAVVMLEQTPMVASRNVDGTATIMLSGRYSKQRAGRIYAALYDRSSGSAVQVSGYSAIQVPLTETAMVGLWGNFTGSFVIDAITATTLVGKPLEIWIWRDDVISSANTLDTVPWPSQIFYLGINVMFYGQSLSVFQSNQTATTAATPPTGSQWINAYSSTVNSYDRQTLVQSPDRLPAHLSKRWGDLSGMPMTLVAAGVSGTPQSQRIPGTAQFIAAADGITHAGGRVDYIVNTTGHSNADDANAYYNDLSLTYSGNSSFANINRGGAARVIMMPISSSHNATDVAYQSVREAEMRLVENGIAQSMGPSTFDLRKWWNGTDLLHHGTSTTDPYASEAKIMQRIGQFLSHQHGYATHDGRGPAFSAIVRIDAQTVKCYYADGGSWFDNFELVGSQSHGGMRFSATSDPLAPIWPTSCSVTAGRVPSGIYAGMFEVTFVFSANSFPSLVYGWCGYGSNPHNPMQDSTINQTTWDDIALGASILRGTKAGVPAGLDYVGIQPRIRYSTPSYLVSS
jgi:hypothetical protein